MKFAVFLLWAFSAFQAIADEGGFEQSRRTEIGISVEIEQDIDTRSELLTHATQVTAYHESELGIAPLFRLGVESYSLIGDPDVFFPGSFAYAGPGLGIDYGNLSLTMELRLRQHLAKVIYDPEEDEDVPYEKSDVDFFVELIYADDWNFPIAWLNPFVPFTEVYTETQFTLTDERNIFHASYGRLGLAVALWGNLSFAPFLQPLVALDRTGYYENNFFDLRLGSRLSWSGEQLELTLTAAQISRSYLSSKDRDPEEPDLSGGFRASFDLAISL